MERIRKLHITQDVLDDLTSLCVIWEPEIQIFQSSK